jgi:acetylornithine/succinyldiaminopimelate/putrescine aminotransferase
MIPKPAAPVDVQLNTYAQFPFTLARGEGNYVWDTRGNRYLDLYGGHAVCLTGHSHPKVVAAIKRQAEELLFYSNVAPMEIRDEACRKLRAFAPPGSWRIFLCNSGTEANETAMKIARKYTGRLEVLSFEGSFHGRTLGSLSATGTLSYHKGIQPLVAHHRYLPWGDETALAREVNDRTAALIFEPIQSMAGVRVGTPSFYAGLVEQSRRHGALLVADEVQSAVGRTGKPMAVDHWGVVPDLVTTAKGIASGIPCGAVLISEKIAQTIGVGDQGTTFGGGPVACAAMAATMDLIRQERLIENARRCEERLRKALASNPAVGEIRGKGLLLGLRFKRPAKEIQQALLKERIITGTSADPHVLRLLPPLTLGEEEIRQTVDALEAVAS